MPLSEDKIIGKYFAPLSKGNVAACGLVDDCALLGASPDGSRVVTSDMLIAGVHFFADDHACDIAWKALGVNVSDIVSSGGKPEYYLLSIALNDNIDESWLADFSAGLGRAQSKFGLWLIGGDTTRTEGPLAISITAIGSVPASGHKMRRGAGAGHHVYATGTIGDSALGCALRRDPSLSSNWGLSDQDREFLVDRYLRPAPRLEMIGIVREYASACMDISDGLILDFDRLGKASNVGALMLADDVPLSDVARRVVGMRADMLGELLTGGDDYELLLTVPAVLEESFLTAVGGLEYPVQQIGTCTDKSEGINWLKTSGEKLCVEARGFDHFNLRNR